LTERGDYLSIFAIADTHLSMSCNKPMDIFGGWDDYVQRLEKNWKALIEDKDTVVIAGDISWAMNFKDCVEDFHFLNSLPGQKLIFKGNHDYWWNTMAKMNCFLYENHFDSIKILHNDAVKIGKFAVCGSRGWFFDADEGKDKKVLLREAERVRRSIKVAKSLEAEPLVFLHYPPLTNQLPCPEIMNVLAEEEITRVWYGHLHGPSLKNAFNS